MVAATFATSAAALASASPRSAARVSGATGWPIASKSAELEILASPRRRSCAWQSLCCGSAWSARQLRPGIRSDAMISYDDIVKAGSNIGGWEGKRGFYAVERYYEMAEKLRVQGYEKLQAP